MKQIQNKKKIYRIKKDNRSFSLRFGRYLYLAVLSILALTLFHLAFSFLYVLTGDGFVTADKEAVAFEYDASIEAVLVANGDKVKKGEELFLYDSIDYRNNLLNLLFKQSNLLQSNTQSNINLKKVLAQLEATRRHLDISEGIVKKIKILEKKGLIVNRRRSLEYERYFDNLSELNEQKAEQEELTSQKEKNTQQLSIITENINNLIDNFKDGVATSPADGVVGELKYAEGDVVEKTNPILYVFSEFRYLLVYFNSSFIKAKVGETVSVYIPGKGLFFGTITDQDFISSAIPDEIKPRFRPPKRRRAMVIVLDEGVLKDVPIMKSVTVYKPVGIVKIINIFDYKNNHMERYQKFLQEREKENKRERAQHATLVEKLDDKIRDFSQEKAQKENKVKEPLPQKESSK